MNSKNTKKIESRITCEFCKKLFVKEANLLVHSCERKRRWQARDEKVVKIGFYVFQRFYEINFRNREGNKKKFDDFINSQFYSTFVAFGKYLREINAVDQDDFITFLIRNNVKAKDWTKISIYRNWIKDQVKKELPLRAFERAVLVMQQWALENDDLWNNFFRNVNSNLAVSLICNGRISPWLIYSQSGIALLNRLNDTQMDLIQDIIDPEFWTIKLKQDVDMLKQLADFCEEFGL